MGGLTFLPMGLHISPLGALHFSPGLNISPQECFTFLPGGFTFLPGGFIFLPWGLIFLPRGLHISPLGLYISPLQALHFSPGSFTFLPRGFTFLPGEKTQIPLGRNMKPICVKKIYIFIFLHYMYWPTFTVNSCDSLVGSTDIHTKGCRPRLLSCLYFISELSMPARKLLLPGKSFIDLYVLQFP